jgi:KDO2-lipid IV(A) lauroyltransferase
MYKILFSFFWLLGLLPLRALYLVSDFCYLLAYYVFKYRRNVVKENLKLVFPEMTHSQRLKIEKKFYRFFCDVIVETVSEMHMSRAEMKSRMKFINVEEIIRQYDNGKSCMLMTAHYGNWEWASTLSVWLPEDKPLYGIYKQLANKNFDHLMCELRMRFQGKNIEKNDLARKMLELKINKQLAMFGMIADQTPMPLNANTWIKFLNIETLTTIGTEILAKKFDYPVYFAKISCIKRGYYQCEFIPISLTPKETENSEITEKYMNLLEQSIMDAPEYWLWTHNRWKYSNLKTKH